MKKIILVNGLIAGFIIILVAVVSINLDGMEHVAGLEWLGYLIMILALSLVFFGIKQYRDQDLGGVIRFGTALKVGLGISLVASMIYVMVWEINLAATDYAFMDQYVESRIEQLREEGVDASTMEQEIAELEEMKASYAKPAFRLGITFLEIFPVGLLISLISAAILRRSSVLPA